MAALVRKHRLRPLCYGDPMRGGKAFVSCLVTALAMSWLSACQWYFTTTTDAPVLDAPAADAPVDPIGCSDGTREGFASIDAFPAIAGCEGGWSKAGMRTGPQCGLQSGNTGTQPTGIGCAAADLCSAGWHVCNTRSELSTAFGAGSCDGATQQANAFFATTLGSKPGTSWMCNDAPTASDDLYGCGTIGSTPPSSNECLPLTRASDNACSKIGAQWVCPPVQGTTEQTTVTKIGGAGGVLCCRL